MNKENQIIIYQTSDGKVALDVNIRQETVWLTQKQMTLLFDRERSVITKHIRNVFEEGELEQNQVCANFALTAADGKSYQVEHYNLDVVISVGYRVKSKQGSQFRIWATKILKDYLVEGYVLNQKRLREANQKYVELQKILSLSAEVGQSQALSPDERKGILKVLQQYAYALDTLDKYDHQRLEIDIESGQAAWTLTYEDAIMQIAEWRRVQNAGNLFGNEKDDSFKGSLETIYQTFDGQDLYPGLEEKAANLLYFIVKNHSFSDGNKRIAAGLFVYFLGENGKLFRPDGSKRIGDNALVAITIMIAESKPEEKDIMVKLVVNLINHKN